MEGELQHILGRNLRATRKRMGLSQEGLAERLDWHRTYVGSVERGERNLTLRTVERLCESLGLDPLDLLWDAVGLGVSLGELGVDPALRHPDIDHGHHLPPRFHRRDEGPTDGPA
ncbi:MAG TPA: helix-turn-helix transcriptional regulator [Acidimicrobiales bacterium]|nr:helix-turn-helix transcriptional regulator [Acidimicrobiales bacterium]